MISVENARSIPLCHLPHLSINASERAARAMACCVHNLKLKQTAMMHGCSLVMGHPRFVRFSRRPVRSGSRQSSYLASPQKRRDTLTACRSRTPSVTAAASQQPLQLILYTKPECPLCVGLEVRACACQSGRHCCRPFMLSTCQCDVMRQLLSINAPPHLIVCQCSASASIAQLPVM